MGEPSAEIDARIARPGGMPGKQPDDDERQDDRGGRAEQIERKRQRQVVTLAKAVRPGRDRERARPGEGGAERDGLLVPPAPEPAQMRGAVLCFFFFFFFGWGPPLGALLRMRNICSWHQRFTSS